MSEFLATHTGELKKLWDFLNFWDEQVPAFDGGPIRYAKTLGLLEIPSILAHVNYCDDEELAILASGRASVIYCPRTHAYFAHPPHRFRDMLGRGINVAIGTDSCEVLPISICSTICEWCIASRRNCPRKNCSKWRQSILRKCSASPMCAARST